MKGCMLPPDASHSPVCFNVPSSRAAIYDVVEEKVDSEPDFQYIPEKSPPDPAQLDQHALRDSVVTLKEGLSSGAILSHFDVSYLHTNLGGDPRTFRQTFPTWFGPTPGSVCWGRGQSGLE